MADHRKTIAIYGATGYSGRSIAKELIAMGHDVLLTGRSPSALRQLSAELGGVDHHVVELDDSHGLAALASRVGTLVNAAGPFARTCAPVAAAAIAGGCHYVDISGEQQAIRALFDTYGSAAAAADVALVPSAAFYAALADLLVSLAATGFERVDDLDLAYHITDWVPSGAALEARLRGLALPVMAFDDGLVELRGQPPTRSMDFPAPIGRRRVVAYPLPEVLTIPRHVPVRRIRPAMTASTVVPAFAERFAPQLSRVFAWGLRSPLSGAFERVAVAAGGGVRTRIANDPTHFHIVARLSGGGMHRTAALSGPGIFDSTGPIAARIAGRTVEDDFTASGPLAAAEVVDPAEFLDALRERGIRYRIDDAVVERHDPATVNGEWR
ncbi:saccharopine dehydrogenase NADP-binding domain-containing protein [Nocardia transvalensis]|uniref:saccharopine dehydrogenase NADP-binding domain-containing protein n=1 Tax=Nocardia transvalensis TaxID=37333 RepID=UPI0018957749|nr:saccharopine dehydrogenase NADP-binding domain-containing protein [Nocardia transvalensis]MBF6328103.1 saccharopine dehydrogenase NADP-binding domain-containing protein [Nocardia transvalensis]